ncbi:LysR family transcriptional regulator [Novosphingobium sp. ERN07]|uniref:LysR family transcriptional regulator n=1 Tax=Novosphingobium sp. ERN07 TaxID=2726187 RepID=UPI0014568BBE|nr:LysR family transcriptional regulator [Novosphingobium sp. ERN07]
MDRLSELATLVEVIDRGDYSRAARSLQMTPSAVSKTIKRLEMRLGARLFNRTSRTMCPTTDGEALYESAKSILQALDDAEERVTGTSGEVRGDLRIQAPPTFALYQLARVHGDFIKRFPAVRIEYLLGNEPLDMSEHRIDLQIMIGQPPDSDLLARKIATSRWVICASPIYLAERGVPQTVEDLEQHECLGYSLEGRRSWLARGGLEISTSLGQGASIASNNGSMLQALARVGAGIVRLADYHVVADLAAGRLIELLPGVLEEKQSVYALYSRKMRDSAKVKSFVSFLQEQFSTRAWEFDSSVR